MASVVKEEELGLLVYANNVISPLLFFLLAWQVVKSFWWQNVRVDFWVIISSSKVWKRQDYASL